MVDTQRIVKRNASIRTVAQVADSANTRGVLELDLAFNNIDSGKGLESFPAIATLILDHNKFTSLKQMP